MPRVDLGPVGIKGLNSDTPAQKLDYENFSEGLNMRPFDGSLQGVFDFRSPTVKIDGALGGRNIYAFNQWTPSGSNEFNAVYLWDQNTDGQDLEIQIITDITDPTNDYAVNGASFGVSGLDDNDRFNIDLFAFNEIIIVNNGSATPREVRIVTSQDVTNNNDLTPYLGRFAAFPLTGWIDGLTAERLIPYNNRIIALNANGTYTSSSQLGNVSLLWSTPITSIGTLTGVDFVPQTINSAGDDFATESVGEILDAGQLGEYLIVYKEDAVLQYQDTGDPLYLVGRLLFEDDGLYNPGCFKDIGDGRHFVVGNYGIYLHDGGPNKQNISRGRIERALYSDVHPLGRNRAFTFRHSRDKEVWVCYSSASFYGNGTGSGCDRAFVYNYQNDSWYKRDLPTTLTHGVRGITESEINGQVYIYAWGYNGIKQLWNEQDDVALRRYLPDGYVEFLHSDLGEPGITKDVRQVYPICNDTIGIEITSSNILNSPANFTSIQEVRGKGFRTYDPSVSYKEDYRLNGRYYNFRLEMTSENNGQANESPRNPTITGMGIDVSTGGNR
jgi:hypothetical protein